MGTVSEKRKAQAIVLTGTMSEICAKLAKEAQGGDGMNFKSWLELRGHEKRVEIGLAHLSVVRSVASANEQK